MNGTSLRDREREREGKRENFEFDQDLFWRIPREDQCVIYTCGSLNCWTVKNSHIHVDNAYFLYLWTIEYYIHTSVNSDLCELCETELFGSILDSYWKDRKSVV